MGRVPSKTLYQLLANTHKILLKLTWKDKGTIGGKTILKKNVVRGITLLIFRIYQITTVIKTV